MAAGAAIVEVDPSHAGSASAIDEIVRLEKKIFPKHESLAKSFEEELKRRNSGLLYAKVGAASGEEEEVIGYVMYSWVSSLCASVTKLAVKERYRRQGHGEALLRAAMEKCRTRRIRRISLHVDPARAAAVSLYKKMGFQMDAVIQSYYSPGRNAHRMYLEFEDSS